MKANGPRADYWFVIMNHHGTSMMLSSGVFEGLFVRESLSIRRAARRLLAGSGRFASAMALSMAACTAALPSGPSAGPHADYTAAAFVGMPVGRQPVVNGRSISYDDVLWLARAIYSETKQPHEQELVAWVVRNRVETGYRGKATYQDVILDPFQFSAFNPGTATRAYYTGLDWDARPPGFLTALHIAFDVATADDSRRPFSISTRHFYSARSMTDGRRPAWAEDRHPVALDRDIDPERFRFYERVV